MRTYKRLIAMLVSASMVLSVLPQFALTVRADAADVITIWGIEGSESDPESLVISEESPGDGYVIVAKMINGGTYTATGADMDYALLINNSEVDATDCDDLALDYYLSGESVIEYPNITVSCVNEIATEYCGNFDDAGEIAEFYSPNKYDGWDGEHYNFIKYDYDVTGEFHGGGLDARMLTIASNAEYIMDNWEHGEGEFAYYTANVTWADVVIVYGDIFIADNEGKTDYVNELNVEVGISVLDDGSITGSGNGRLSMEPGSTIGDGLELYEIDPATSAPVPMEFPLENRVSFEYMEDDGQWLLLHGEENFEADPEEGQLVVHFDDYSFFDEEEGRECPHAFVMLNYEPVSSGVPIDFEVANGLYFDLETYRDYDISDCIVEIRQATGEGDEVEVFTSYSEDPEYLIDIVDGTFTFTPSRNNPIYVDIFWCKLDTLQPNDDQVRFDVYSGGPGGFEVSGITPVKTETAPNGTYRAIFNKSDFDGEKELTVTLTSQPGGSLVHFGYEINDLNMGFDSWFDDETRSIRFPEIDGFTDNGDGTYTYKISSFGNSTEGPVIASISPWFEFAHGLPGFTFDPHGAKLYYSLDGGENYTEIKFEEYEDGWNGYFLDIAAIGDATEVTFKFEIPEDEQDWKEFYSVYVETFNYRYYSFNMPFDSDDAYVITFEKPECGWLPVNISANEWYAPLDGTYMIYLKGEGSDRLNIEADGIDKPATFVVGEPIKFTITDEVYGVYARTVGSGAETEIEPVNNVYSYTPDSTAGVEIDVYVTKDEYDVDHMWPENENEYMVEFNVREDGFPPEAERGEVEILENDHILRCVNSGGRYRLIVEYDVNDQDFSDNDAIVQIRIKVPAHCEFSVWDGSVDYTSEVYENEMVFDWDIKKCILDIGWSCPDINFMYREVDDNQLSVDYDDCYYSDGEGEPHAHAEVLVNNSHVDPRQPVDLEEGKAFTVKIAPPEGYEFSEAIVDVEQGEHYWSTAFDAGDPYKIVINERGELTFTPAGSDPVFIYISWSEFDAVNPERGQIQVEYNYWGNGSVELVEGPEELYDYGKSTHDNRVRYIYDAVDVISGEPVIIDIVPSTGNILSKIDYDVNGHHYEYFRDSEGDENRLTFEDLDGLVDNGDGTFTYTIDTVDFGDDDRLHVSINFGFDNPLGCEGISIDPKGGKVYYKFDDDLEYTELPVREFEDEWNKWEEIRLLPEEIEDAHYIYIKFEFEDERDVYGVELSYCEDESVIRSYRCFTYVLDNVYILSKPGEEWANYRLSVMDYEAPYDGQYAIYAMGEGAEEIEIDGYNLGDTVEFTLGEPITFSFDQDVYGVYVVNRSTFEEIELIPADGVYSYTPDSYDSLEIKIYTTETEYKLDHLHAEGENQREVDFWIDRFGFPDGADLGDVIIPENEHIKEWINSAGHVKLIVEWDQNDPAFESAIIDLTVKVPNDTELRIWENNGEVETQVVDGTYVYHWDVTGVFTGGEWSSSHIEFEYLPGITIMDMPEGVGVEYSVDGGSTYQPVDGDRINLYEDMHSVKLRFVEQNEDVTVYGIHYFVGNQAYRERLNANLVYDFERGEHWISYSVVPVVTDSMFDNEWTYEFAMPEDKDIVVFKNNVSDGINNFGKFSTVTIKADNVYCIEAVNVYGEIRKFSKSGNTFKLVMNDAAGFTAYIYTSKEEYEFVNLEPVGEQYHVYYYSDSESEQTGTVSVAGEVARKSYNGMTKVIFNAEEPAAVFTITPADNYYYTATRDGEAFSGTVDLSEWDIDWPVIEFVQKTDISGATVTLDPAGDQIYTGSAITPAVKVTLNNVELTADEEYTVAYSNNVEAGVATVTVTGTGKFSGTATATFNIVKAVYTVSVVCSDNGTATVSKTSANEGDVITVTATPGSDFELDTIKVDGTAIEGTTFTMPGKDVTVTVTFKQKVYAVTVSETSNGTATVSKTTASAGEVITVTATPADGYSLDTIKVNGTAIEGTTFTMPAQAVTVEVTFKKNAPAKNGWILDNGKYYYYDNGVMVTGWKSSGGKWYYMDPETGIMVTGWLDLDGTWYYLNGSGAMLTGWQQVRGKWYYFENSGAMKTGWLSDGGKWYYLTSSGAMATGWQQAGGEWYYFESSGAMTEPGWKEIGGKWYYFKKSGAMASKEYCGGYWLNEDGSWTYPHKASWRGNDESGWWYGDDSGWYAENEKLTIDGKVYEFDARGYWIKN